MVVEKEYCVVRGDASVCYSERFCGKRETYKKSDRIQVKTRNSLKVRGGC